MIMSATFQITVNQTRVTKDKSYFHIHIYVMFNEPEKNCNYFALFLANFKERESWANKVNVILFG